MLSKDIRKTETAVGRKKLGVTYVIHATCILADWKIRRIRNGLGRPGVIVRLLRRIGSIANG